MPLFAPHAALAGGMLGGSLIIAIGAQNAFVLRHGLRRQRVFLVAALCSVCDWLLISLGAGGFGALVSGTPPLVTGAAWLGAAFLFVYGARSFRSAMRQNSLTADDDAAPDGSPANPDGSRTPLGAPVASLAATVAATLAVSLLNPHAILDTVVLTGGIAAQYPLVERPSFALGAMLASLVWFFSLAYGARLLAPVFARPSAWRVLDALIGVVMWWIAATLVFGQFAPA